MARSRPRSRSAPLDRVPEDLPGRRAQSGASDGERARGELALDPRQPLGHPPAGLVEVDRVLEDHADHREADVARRPHHADAARALQAEGQGIGDLVLDLAWAVALPVGEDDDLVLRQVGDRVHRREPGGPDPEDGQDEAGGDHQRSGGGSRSVMIASIMVRGFAVELGEVASRDSPRGLPGSRCSRGRRRVRPRPRGRASPSIPGASGSPGRSSAAGPGADRRREASPGGERSSEVRRDRSTDSLERRGLACAPRAEVAGRQARVQPRLGVEQEGPRDGHLLAGFQAPHNRVGITAARTEHDLDAVEHAGHGLDEDDRSQARVDDRRFREPPGPCPAAGTTRPEA